ncbi:MAG: V/A-type H+/Na+-transporting ATPase subunit [Epulopiscium sp.]|jgi:V/A-type H+-transporting ATPase subunit K|uniref:ATP synthase F(0) sector subunit c n=1 Tax=Defluviitalea raffinosedens TaxID=1450156 RepID=A0A7C8LJ98_9FIRM|nr:ATP synthase subunit C [Defluviitalea raffinosedens]MBZ4668108.1 putative ATPase related protein [Defluviitaleaceae bacterium]MDK2789237.1 V/A-type H+/Na+-transporting ATPase subunit [Candidatus Epulonipiscium sp.]KAE9634045.1 ATPase [Defluviitalea raffinosedens]MBM7685825.1 V/A-type H+-transporting ATPase subunit K [Defluviitalea raffinosedens]HHW67987.1 ATPase [Candidatus Epulonipiscium sp.]
MNLLLIIAGIIAGITVILGCIDYFKKKETSKSQLKKSIGISAGSFAAVLLGAITMLVPDIIMAAETAAASGANSGSGLGFIAAALSTGMATIGAGYAVGAVGSSALGAVSEDPKILGKTLIFVGLAEGIAIYGLIISIMILGRL